jgi:hypothetical protein
MVARPSTHSKFKKEAKMTRPIPISKNTAQNELTAEVEAFLEKAIEIINGKLKNFSAGSYRNVYDSDININSLSGDAEARVIEEIKATYKAAGWKVEYRSGDWKDPESIFTFS